MRGVLIRMRAGAGASNDDGVSLVELLVSLVVFAIIAAALASVSLSLIKKTGNNRNREIAAQLLARDLDTVRAVSAGTLTAGTFVQPAVSIGGTSYSVSRLVSKYSPGKSCGVGVQTSWRVSTTISWQEKLLSANNGNGSGASQTKSITGTTIATPTPGTFTSDGTGQFGTVVVDQDGRPLAGIPVTYSASGVSDVVVTSNAEGCALLENLAVGKSYTATLGNASTYVKPGYQYSIDLPNFSSSPTTIVGSTASQFNATYGNKAILNMSTTTDAAHPAPANMPFTVYNSSFPTGVYSTKWLQLTPTTTGSMVSGGVGPTAASFAWLFPSNNGYVPWAGDCGDADPGVSSGYRGAGVATAPGATVSGSANLVKVDLAMTGLQTGKPLSVRITHTGARTGCSDQSTDEYYVLAPSNVTTGTTTGTSQTLSFSIPYGSWSISAQCNAKTAVVIPKTFTGASVGAATQVVPAALTC